MMAAVMNESRENASVLQSVDVKARLRNLLSEVTVTQTYINHETQAIEAVYTIPLPLDAVLLELQVKLGDTLLTGMVKARATANRVYEDAITDGDAAVLLEQAGDGLYTVNVGNLMPGETALVMFRYAQLHQWQGNSLRFFLPTTVAPRYGDPLRAGLQPHQMPGVSLSVDNRFSFTLEVSGELSGATMDSPSHTLSSTYAEGHLKLALSDQRTAMDRDLIIHFKRGKQTLRPSPVLLGKDGNKTVALASFNLYEPDLDASRTPACFKIVVDCSGSMAGDSIAQAGMALEQILERLLPDDYFNITLFGSSYRLLFRNAVQATPKNLARALNLIARLDADMGGTEMASALKATVLAEGHEALQDNILLITDGEVYGHEEIVSHFKGRRHRIFTIGVGSAVSESFVRQLARDTGGASELVSPRENMAERIVNQFDRMRQPAVQNLQLRWPAHALETLFVDSGQVFLNDTLHLFGWFDEPAAGDIELSYELNGALKQQVLSMPGTVEPTDREVDDLARIAIARKLLTLDDDKEAAHLAETYQLVTRYSSCVLVKQLTDEQKTGEMPALRQVDHMMTAGSHGFGTVMERHLNYSYSLSAAPDFDCDEVVNHMMCEESPREDSRMLFSKLDSSDSDFLDIPAFLRRQTDDDDAYDWRQKLVKQLNLKHSRFTSSRLNVTSFDDLQKLGLAANVIDELKHFAQEHGLDETQVVSLFVYALILSDAGDAAHRSLIRVATAAWKQLPEAVRVLDEEMAKRLV